MFSLSKLEQSYTHTPTHTQLTLQEGESTILQLHHNPLKDWQHGRDVQQDQDDSLGIDDAKPVMTVQWKWMHAPMYYSGTFLCNKVIAYILHHPSAWFLEESWFARGLYNCKSSLPGPCRRHLPWQCCTEESRQSVLQRQSPEHGLGRPAKKGHWKEIAPSECHTLRC